jgi:serine/threonine protein kinase
MKQLFDQPKNFGSFELLERVGRGATAMVYKARQKSDGRLVALKMGARLLSTDAPNFARFKREFTKIRPLRHPHLVEALDFGEEKKVPYLVLEFVDGPTLEQRLREKGPLPLSEALPIILQMASGLQLIHHNRILHRDIKPGNVLLTPQGQAKLGDFGLLKTLATESCMTDNGQAMGTLEFGAPEQFEDAKNTDFRCDIYSMAGTLYAMISGLFPFGRAGLRRILQRKLKNQFVPLRLLLPNLPAELDDLVTRSIHADRAQRPATIDEFIASLNKIVRANDFSAPAPADLVSTVSGPERRTAARVSVSLPAAFVPFHQNKRISLQATIIDISVGGFCLKTNAPVPPKSIVEVTTAQTGATYVAQVRWVKALAANEIIVGCSFACPPSPQEIAAMAPTICQRVAI